MQRSVHRSKVLLRHAFAFFVLLVPTTGAAGAPSPPGEAPGTHPAGLSAADWSGIRRVHEAERHAVRPVPGTPPGSYRAHNPGQRWCTRFDGRGFTTHPDEGGWTWGLALLSYGFAGEGQEVARPFRTSIDGGRLEYVWDAALTEWFENDRRGLEHGYLVDRPPRRDLPDGEQRPLTITLAVRGGLTPQIDTDRRGARFLDEHGLTVLTYSGLIAFDAEGRKLPARLDFLPGRLRISVDERGARYPLTVDPVVQTAYFKASNTGLGDRFGDSVAVSGDTVVVGAPWERSAATIVNGDQSDDSTSRAGAAYVFVLNGETWTQQAYLKASNTGLGDEFGDAVAVFGDTVVVTAPGESSSATGVNGNQSDNSAGDSGAAYVFVRRGTTWSQQAYLKASNTDANDLFGSSVAVSGDTVVVGAVNESSSATGVNGDQDDDSAALAGAAYVFVRWGTIWSQQAYLKASNTDAGDSFSVVALSGDTIVVGARHEDGSATDVNGAQADNGAGDSGAAYVFVRRGTSWSQQAYLKASNAEIADLFGIAVAVSGDTLVVGAPWEDGSATGVNGNQSDNGASLAGAAYVFVRRGTIWRQQAYLKASNTGVGDLFGRSVGIWGHMLVVGAFQEDSASTGVNGDGTNDGASESGAAYLFVRRSSTWSQKAYLKSSNTDPSDGFGLDVGVSRGTVVVGAISEDSSATGVNGSQTSSGTPGSGACYAFLIGTPPPLSVLRNGSGINPVAYTVTPPVVGSTLEAAISRTRTSIGTAIVVGLGGSTYGTFGPGGELLVLPPFRIFSSATGRFAFALPADSSLLGRQLFTQGLRFEPEGLVWLNAQDLVFGD